MQLPFWLKYATLLVVVTSLTACASAPSQVTQPPAAPSKPSALDLFQQAQTSLGQALRADREAQWSKAQASYERVRQNINSLVIDHPESPWTIKVFQTRAFGSTSIDRIDARLEQLPEQIMVAQSVRGWAQWKLLEFVDADKNLYATLPFMRSLMVSYAMDSSWGPLEALLKRFDQLIQMKSGDQSKNIARRRQEIDELAAQLGPSDTQRTLLKRHVPAKAVLRYGKMQQRSRFTQDKELTLRFERGLQDAASYIQSAQPELAIRLWVKAYDKGMRDYDKSTQDRARQGLIALYEIKHPNAHPVKQHLRVIDALDDYKRAPRNAWLRSLADRLIKEDASDHPDLRVEIASRLIGSQEHARVRELLKGVDGRHASGEARQKILQWATHQAEASIYASFQDKVFKAGQTSASSQVQFGHLTESLALDPSPDALKQWIEAAYTMEQFGRPAQAKPFLRRANKYIKGLGKPKPVDKKDRENAAVQKRNLRDILGASFQMLFFESTQSPKRFKRALNRLSDVLAVSDESQDWYEYRAWWSHVAPALSPSQLRALTEVILDHFHEDYSRRSFVESTVLPHLLRRRQWDAAMSLMVKEKHLKHMGGLIKSLESAPKPVQQKMFERIRQALSKQTAKVRQRSTLLASMCRILNDEVCWETLLTDLNEDSADYEVWTHALASTAAHSKIRSAVEGWQPNRWRNARTYILHTALRRGTLHEMSDSMRAWLLQPVSSNNYSGRDHIIVTARAHAVNGSCSKATQLAAAPGNIRVFANEHLLEISYHCVRQGEEALVMQMLYAYRHTSKVMDALVSLSHALDKAQGEKRARVQSTLLEISKQLHAAPEGSL